MKWKKLIDAFLWVMAPVIAACYVILPATNDLRIYLGVEHIAASYYPFPAGLDLAWEIKPIGNRIVNFLLYKIATVFVPFEDHFLFGVAVKLLALAAIICVAYYFSRKVAVPYSFLLVFYTFTTMANFCTLQAEYWAAVCAVLAIAMLVSRSWFAWYGAGALMVGIFLLKGITGLLVVPVLCGAYLLLSKPDEIDPVQMVVDFIRLIQRAGAVVLGGASAVVLVLAGWYLWWPNLVADMLLSPHLARVGQTPLENLIVWFIAQFILSPLYIPVLLIGIVFGAIFYFAYILRQDFDIKLAYVLMWLAPVAIVMIQGEMFLYHYLAFVPAAVVSVVLCEREAVG